MKSDNGNYVQQLAIKESSTQAFIRYLGGSLWSAWKEISMNGHAHTASDVGAAPYSHTSSTASFGAASGDEYGHMRFGGIGQSNDYVMPMRNYGNTDNLNIDPFLTQGIYFISFDKNTQGTKGLPMIGDAVYPAELFVLPPDYITGNSNLYSLQQILSVPGLNAVYHRIGFEGGFSDWFEFLDSRTRATDIGAVADSFRGTLLWSGAWSSDSITVPNFDKYNLFYIGIQGSGTPVIAVRNGEFFRGIGGFSSTSPTLITYYFAATVNGNTISSPVINHLSHTSSGTHETIANDIVTRIIGII